MPDWMLVVLGALGVIGLGVVMTLMLVIWLFVMEAREEKRKLAKKAATQETPDA